MPISRVRSLIVGEIGVLLPLENRGDSTTGPRDKSNSDKRLITLADKWDMERGERTHVDLMTSVRSSWSLHISCAIHDQPNDILPHQIEAPLQPSRITHTLPKALYLCPQRRHESCPSQTGVVQAFTQIERARRP